MNLKNRFDAEEFFQGISDTPVRATLNVGGHEAAAEWLLGGRRGSLLVEAVHELGQLLVALAGGDGADRLLLGAGGGDEAMLAEGRGDEGVESGEGLAL